MLTNIKKRNSQSVAFWIFRILSLLVLGILISIISFILVKGIGVIKWDFLTQIPDNSMSIEEIYPAITGTICLIFGSILFAVPIGVMSCIYIYEFSNNKLYKKLFELTTSILSGVPSIIFGLFGIILFVDKFGFGNSILAGSLTLGLLALPIIIRATEDALKTIDNSYREASYALGASKLETIKRITLPMALPKILIGILSSIGRVSGETAPILFMVSAFSLHQLPTSIFDQFTALPIQLYSVAVSEIQNNESSITAFGIASLLILAVIILNIISNIIRRFLFKKFKTN
jgi:phosphate transport system permease protein